MGEEEKGEKLRDKEGQRGTEVGIPWHVVALVHSTNESKTHDAGRQSDEEGWKNTPRKASHCGEVSREVKGGGAGRYAMCEITITHP